MGKWIISFVVAIVVIFFGFNFFSNVSAKNERKARDKIFRAVYKFEEGKYETALDGENEDEDGFEQVVRKYGVTSVGKLAHLYAATCWLQLYKVLFAREKCQNGIQHLEYLSFDNSKLLNEKKESLMGDLYVESGLFNDGGLAFISAAQKSIEKKFQPYYLFKASLAFPEDRRTPQAISALKEIIRNFPDHPYTEKARQRIATLK
ncbi:MAG: hypothetical protein LBD32_02035 [Cytophagales bacterium]|jgi:predicted negative regulator of RcsB-dependent stress response|nr:hypothetical protein [Cytophagales bacterium]